MKLSNNRLLAMGAVVAMAAGVATARFGLAPLLAARDESASQLVVSDVDATAAAANPAGSQSPPPTPLRVSHSSRRADALIDTDESAPDPPPSEAPTPGVADDPAADSAPAQASFDGGPSADNGPVPENP